MALGCRDMNLDLQVERSEIPIYRGCLGSVDISWKPDNQDGAQTHDPS